MVEIDRNVSEMRRVRANNGGGKSKAEPRHYISVRSSTGFDIIYSYDLVVEISGAVIFPLSAAAAFALASFLVRAISSTDWGSRKEKWVFRLEIRYTTASGAASIIYPKSEAEVENDLKRLRYRHMLADLIDSERAFPN